jgi:hypothetical protein
MLWEWSGNALGMVREWSGNGLTPEHSRRVRVQYPGHQVAIPVPVYYHYDTIRAGNIVSVCEDEGCLRH